jgi:hypothetical protein
MNRYQRRSPRPLPQVNTNVAGLAGLEPAASSLSGFCPRACFRRIAPATCANDLPLETIANRSAPMACGPNVDQARSARGAAALRVMDLAWQGDPSGCPRHASPGRQSWSRRLLFIMWRLRLHLLRDGAPGTFGDSPPMAPARPGDVGHRLGRDRPAAEAANCRLPPGTECHTAAGCPLPAGPGRSDRRGVGVRLAGLNSTAEQLQADPLEGRVVVGVLDQQPGRLGAVVADQSTAGPAARASTMACIRAVLAASTARICSAAVNSCSDMPWPGRGWQSKRWRASWSAAAMASNSSRRPGFMTLMLRPYPDQAYPRDAFKQQAC